MNFILEEQLFLSQGVFVNAHEPFSLALKFREQFIFLLEHRLQFELVAMIYLVLVGHLLGVDDLSAVVRGL
jgi:hypothetical protein